MNRRTFLNTLLYSSPIFLAPSFSSCSRSNDKLNILILGGTNFLGPAIVESAINKGHTLTLFNRGITNPGLFPDLEHIRGDREQGPEAYKALRGRPWDVVIDVWPEKAKLVEEATEALQKHTDSYVFISSIGVYDNFQEVGLNERSDVLQPGPDRKRWGYGEEKIHAEEIVRKRFPDSHLILRPGPIKGWRDPAQDLLYWLVKLQKEENLLAPGSGDDPLQFIDVKDVGRFVTHGLEKQLQGVYNCTGPREQPLLWKEFLSIAKKHLGSDAELIWPGEAFLKEQEVRSFDDLPLWAPLSEDQGFMQISAQKALATGFTFTSIEQTIDDSLRWWKQPPKQDIEAGLSREKEVALIEQWTSANN